MFIRKGYILNKDLGLERTIKVVLIVLSIVFVFSIVVLFLPYALLFIDTNSLNKYQLTENPVFQYSEIISLLLSFLALAFAIAIATPYFISKNQINATVRKYLENEYKNDVEKSVENFNRTDAHLSRMIGFLLMGHNYYYWAIGWSFRSLKRYKNLQGDYNNVYKDFHKFIIRDILSKCVDTLNKNPTSDKSSDIFYTTIEEEQKTSITDLKIRAIKDYLDFEFEIQCLYKCKSFSKEIRNTFNTELDDIRKQIKNIITYVKEECCSLKDKKDLFHEVLKCSAYRSKETIKAYKKFISDFIYEEKN